MKRFLSLIFLILSLILMAAAVLGRTDRHRYSDFQVSEAEFEAIRNSRTPAGEDPVDRLTFNNHPLFFDRLNDRWFYSVSPEAPDTDPVFGYTSPGKEVRIAFCGEIAPGAPAKMIAYDADEYKTYSLAVTTLPLLSIEYGAEFEAQLNDHWKDIFAGRMAAEDAPMKLTLFDNRRDSSRPVIVSDGLIHLRGRSTLEFPKKGLRIKLLEKTAGKEDKEYQVPLLGMRADGDWLLYSGYNDQEKIRNVFSMNLWYNSCAPDNSFGIVNGMEYRFVELFLNREYWGLYALGFPVDAKQAGIRPDSQGHYREFLFKQQAFGPEYGNLDTGTNGFIFQLNADESDLNNGTQILKMYFSQLFDGAPGGLWHNDIPNVLDIWLFMKLGQAYDSVLYTNQLKNVMYTIKLTDEGRKILFTPWDADNYWGNVWKKDAKNKTVPYGLDPDNNNFEMTVNPVSVLKEKDPGIMEMVRERYADLRAGAWSDQVIDAMLDGFERDIYDSGAYVRDMERWPDGTYQDPELKLSVFREYVHSRFISMDRWIEGSGPSGSRAAQ